uniref:Acetylcholine receptor subunit alpha-like n=1 Tax=Cacopsylla melanoneura TaxID=428564 RepID=A0A8D8VW77_9HEMI
MKNNRFCPSLVFFCTTRRDVLKICLFFFFAPPPLFSSADGSYEVTIQTKAKVFYTGQVLWEPPAVYKSSCAIDVEFFPYDIQTCVLKLGSWTYDGFKVNVKTLFFDCHTPPVILEFFECFSFCKFLS